MSLKSPRRKEIPKSSWVWDIESGDLSLGLTFLKLFGEDADYVPNDLKKSVQKTFYSSEINEEINFYRKTQHEINGCTYYIEWIGEAIERNTKGKISKMAGFAELGSSPDNFTLSLNQEALFFARLMDNVRESVFFKDLESRFIKINKACAEKFGLEDPSEIIGKTDFDFFSEEHARPAFEDEQNIIKTEEPLFDKIEKEVFSDGSESVKWASTSKMPLYDDKGVLIGTYGITRDITKEERAKEQLKERDKFFLQLSESAPGFLYLHKVDTQDNVSFPFVSDGIKDVLELNPKELNNSIRPLFKLVHEEDLGRVMKSIIWSVKTQKEWTCEFRVILPKKGLRWVRGKAKPELKEDGSVLSSGFLSDITKEKEISELNDRLKKQFQAVLDNVPNLIFIKDLNGIYLMANKATREFYGVSEDEIIGKKDVDLGVPEQLARGYRAADIKVSTTGETLFVSEMRSTDSSGRDIYHQTIKVPFYYEGLDEPTVLAIVTDISKRKQKDLELNKTLDIVGEQNKRLTNFAHIVSHNLRNHAGGISMLISLFEVEESEKEKEELLGYLKKASESLNASIKDLNEIIDQEHKTKKILKDLDPADMIEKVKDILHSEILSNNVEFKEKLDDGISIKYNPAYLESIILNLISNAIKYRDPKKRPEITISLTKKDDSVFLTVEDNGLGIDMKKHGEKLFGMYNTFHGNENSKGIGLFITKNQIESMGGSIYVESEPGKGTIFNVKLI